MKQLTLRGFDKPLKDRVRALARERGISLNRAALLLMRLGAGLDDEGKARDVVGRSLDGFIGDWTAAEAREFESAVSVFEQVDEESWK
jgi:hypothetical protein